MSSVNKVIIVGHLGRDPEVRSFPDGTQVANVSVATTDKWKDKQTGEMREATEWHRVVFIGRLAEIAGEYLAKGSLVYVEGSLKTRKWTDQAGVEKLSTEIRADSMQMLGGRQDGGQDRQQAPRQAAPQQRQQPQRQQGGYGASTRQAPAQGGYGTSDLRGQPRDGGAPGPRVAPAGGSGFDDMDDDVPF